MTKPPHTASDGAPTTCIFCKIEIVEGHENYTMAARGPYCDLCVAAMADDEERNPSL